MKPARRSHSGSEPPAVAFDDENARLMKKAKEFLNFMEPTEEKKDEKEEEKGEEKASKKRKHSETEQEVAGEEEEGPPGLEEEKKDEGDKMEEDNQKDDQKEDDKNDEDMKEEDKKEEGKEENGEENGEKGLNENEEKDLDAVSEGEDATITKEPNVNGGAGEEEAIEKDKEGEVVEPDNEDEDKMDDGEKEESKEKKIDNKDETRRPRALHKTSSIFLRNLAPTITKVEVEALCRRYEGFLRSAIAD